jgi:3-hydroxymyristoyl/3-hydroxydecanoyl-(acyl carrier protein) dehydratase
VASAGGVLHAGDITTPEVQQELVGHVDRLGGSLDFLVLSAADGTRKLNVDTNLALMKAFLPKMRQGGAVVIMQSHMGHFYDVMDKDILFDEYRGVAESKRDEESEARREMRENPDASGKKLFVIVGPTDPESTNVRLWKRIAPESRENMPRFARDLGLPEFASNGEFADKVWEVIEKREELPDGYTDLFSGTTDARPDLKSVYDGEEALYVDTIEENGNAHMVVSEGRIAEANVNIVDNTEGDLNRAASETVIKDEHLQGHFGVLPGHKGLRLVEETMRRVYEPGNDGTTLMLSDVDKVSFQGMIVPGNSVQTVVEKVGHGPSGAIYDAKVSSGNDLCYEMKGLIFRKIAKDEANGMRSHQLAEVAAQAALLAAGGFDETIQGQYMLPIFQGIEHFSVVRTPRKGEALRITPVLKDTGGEKQTVASVDIHIGDELIAWAETLEGAMVKGSTVRGLKRRAERRNSVPDNV